MQDWVPAAISVTPEMAESMLARILASPHFSNARRLSEFLRLITAKAASGESTRIDEQFIGVEIYGRPPHYDPAQDSIVRVEANRLRSKLRSYYQADGIDDKVHVRLPAYSYVPLFEVAPPKLPDGPPAAPEGRPWHLVLALAVAAVTTIAALIPFGRFGDTPRRPVAKLPVSGWSHNREALDLYLQAHSLFDTRKPENLWKSVELYRAAVQKDPRFALAYVGLAKDYVVLGTNEDQDLSQTRPLARQAVARALAIDPNLPDALLTEAATADYRDFASLERSYRAAVAANPSNADARHWWGLNLLAAGRFAEAEAELRQAQSLDPLSVYIRVHIGTVYYCSRRYQDTIDQERTVLALDPHQPRALALEARGYEGIGRYQEAAAILENLLKTTPSVNALADLGHIYAAAGKKDQARQIFETLSSMAKTRHVSPHYLALIQTALGNKNEAIALLDLSLEQHDAPLALLNVDPRWDPLREDTRFQQLLRALCVGR